MVTYNNSRQKIGEINVVMRPGEGVVTTVYTLAGPNSFLGFRSGLVSPTTRRPAPSLRSGRLIDSTFRRASKLGAFHPTSYIWVAAGRIWALGGGSSRVSRIPTSEEETTKSNYFAARMRFWLRDRPRVAQLPPNGGQNDLRLTPKASWRKVSCKDS